ncbi:MAG TPA: hypothetical protein VIR58_05050, partial [Acidimicrobiales bacterium]
RAVLDGESGRGMDILVVCAVGLVGAAMVAVGYQLTGVARRLTARRPTTPAGAADPTDPDPAAPEVLS